MAVTIYDLAREAGVSISTVSKALSGSYTISEKTRRHVLETARRLQYKPNARARSFARQKSGTVIFATELYQSISFENPHMFAILTGVTRSLEEKGYSVLLKHMDKGGATAYVRELMQERLADGVILHAALLSRDLAAFLSHADAPYLVIGRPNFPCNICWMDVNHELAGGVAANYLLDRGYRRILYLGGGPEDAISQMRLKGMQSHSSEPFSGVSKRHSTSPPVGFFAKILAFKTAAVFLKKLWGLPRKFGRSANLAWEIFPEFLS